jgi:hypothetical protein
MIRSNFDIGSSSELNNKAIFSNNLELLSSKLKLAVNKGEVELDTFLEAANFINHELTSSRRQGRQFAVHQMERHDVDYITMILLQTSRKTHQKIIKYLLANLGKVNNSFDICERCDITYGSLRVQMSHIRSNLKKIGINNLILTVRKQNSDNDNGYIIMADKLDMVVKNTMTEKNMNIPDNDTHGRTLTITK